MAKARRDSSSQPDEPRLAASDFLHFVELDEFVQDWRQLGFNDDEDLWQLQLEIMSAPEKAPVIQGTGGLRKLRFSPRHLRSGKSGAARVCYAYFKECWIVLLVMAYAKNRKDSLSAAEKAGTKAYLERIEKWLAKRLEQKARR